MVLYVKSRAGTLKQKNGAKMQELGACGSAPGSTVGSPGSILIGISLCYQVGRFCNPVMDIMGSLVEILGEYGCITQGQWAIPILGC